MKGVYSADNFTIFKAIGSIGFVCAILTACAGTSTVYMAASDTGDYGYSERKLADTRYRVSFRGNSGTPVDLVKDYALLRAAELTIQRNHEWFKVADRITAPQVPPDAVGSEVEVSTGGPAETRCGLFGCSTTRYSPAFSIETVDFPDRRQRYTANIEILMGSGDPVADATVYDAREIVESVRVNI